jgi:hypothetical protein
LPKKKKKKKGPKTTMMRKGTRTATFPMRAVPVEAPRRPTRAATAHWRSF